MKTNHREIAKRVFLILLIISTCIKNFGSIYYVSSNGKDSNTGLNSTSAWQTLAKVNSVILKAGDQVLFERGSTFYGSITIKQPGTSSNPITFGSYGTGANPVITGFTTVTAWTNLGSNIWESTNTVSTLSTCNMVSVNGVNTPMGRYPNLNATNGGYLMISTHNGSASITCNSLTGTENWTGSEIVIRTNRWNLTRGSITSQSGSTLNHNTGVTPMDGWGFFIQNDVRTLDQQNEWYYNPTTKKIRVYSTTQPSNIKVASVERLLSFGYDSNNLSQTSYIVIDGIDFTGANSSAIWGYAHLNSSYQLNSVTIQNCNISFSGGNAVSLVSSPLSILGNTISESNGSAIIANSSGITTIKNNTITNTELIKGQGTLGSDNIPGNSVAINCYGNNNTLIEGNSIVNCGFNAIGFGGTYATIVKNNYINTFNTKLDDGGAIGTGATNGAGTLISGNICINGIGNSEGTPWSGGMVCGIYLDDNSKNIEVAGNTIANCSWIGIYLHNANSNYIHDNIVYNNGTQFRTADDNAGGDVTNNKIKNNQFISRASTQTVCDFASNQNNLTGIGTLDSNYYARPINEGNTINTSQPLGSASRNLASWKTFSGQDGNSKASPGILSSENDFQFTYNNTKSAITITLSQPMVDVKNAKYTGNVVLQPYTSLVLMKDNNPTEITSFTLPGQVGSTVINTNLKTISVSMPSGSSVSNLIAGFSLSAGSTAKVGTVTQVSGSTANNFSGSVVYVVTAKDGVTTKSWTVLVELGNDSNPITKAFNLSDPSLCLGKTTVIKQEGSQIGINYQLQNSQGTPVGEAVLGTGAAIQFSLTPSQSESYKVLATRISDGESVVLSDVALVVVNKIPASPGIPSGNSVVSTSSGEKSIYTINPVSNAENYTWSISPSKAGTIVGDTNTAEATWNNDYTGYAYIMVLASNICGTSSSLQALKITMSKSIETGVSTLEGNVWNPEFMNRYPNGEFIIYDINGRLVEKSKVSITKLKDESSLPNGTYIYVFYPHNGEEPIKGKFVIMN